MARPSSWSRTTRRLQSARGAHFTCATVASNRATTNAWKQFDEPVVGRDRPVPADLHRVARSRLAQAPLGPTRSARGGAAAWAVRRGGVWPDDRNHSHLRDSSAERFVPGIVDAERVP